MRRAGLGAALTVLLFVVVGGPLTARAWAAAPALAVSPRATPLRVEHRLAAQTAPGTTTTTVPCPPSNSICTNPGVGIPYGPGALCLVGGDPNATSGPPGCPAGPDAPGAGLQGNLLGGQCGAPATDTMDVGYSPGGGITYGVLSFVGLGGVAQALNPSRTIPGELTDLTFAAESWTVHAGVCVIYWSLQLKIADSFQSLAGKLTNAYQGRIIGPLSLQSLALFLCFVWCTYTVMRGKVAHGFAELAVSLVLMAMFAAVLSSPQTFLLGPNGFLGRAKSTAVEVAGITASVDPSAAPAPPPPGASSDAAQDAPLMTGLQNAFVKVPWELLDWGEQLDNSVNPAPAGCIAAMNHIAANGPWGTSDTPRNTMAHAGCPQLAQWNANPSYGRLFAAVVVFWGAEIVLVLGLIIAFFLALGQLGLVGCAVWFVWVAVLALIPGGGRQHLWKWVTSVLVFFSMIIATLVTLSLMVVSVDAVVAAESGNALLITMVALDILALAGIIMLFKFRKSLRTTARKVGSSLEGLHTGGAGAGHRWLSPHSREAAGIGLGSAATALYALRRVSQLSRAAGRSGGGGRAPGAGAPTAPVSPADQLAQLDMKDRHRLRSAHERRIADRLDADARGVEPDPDRFWAEHVRPGDMANLSELHAARQAAAADRDAPGGLAGLLGLGGQPDFGPPRPWDDDDGRDVDLLGVVAGWPGSPDEQLTQLDSPGRRRLADAHEQRGAERLDVDPAADAAGSWDDQVEPGDMETLRELHAARRASLAQADGMGGLAAELRRHRSGVSSTAMEGAEDGAQGLRVPGGPPSGAARQRWLDAELVRLGVPEAVGYSPREKEEQLAWARRFAAPRTAAGGRAIRNRQGGGQDGGQGGRPRASGGGRDWDAEFERRFPGSHAALVAEYERVFGPGSADPGLGAQPGGRGSRGRRRPPARRSGAVGPGGGGGGQRGPAVSVGAGGRLVWAGVDGWDDTRRARWVDEELRLWGVESGGGSLERRARRLAEITRPPTADEVEEQYRRWEAGGGRQEARRQQAEDRLFEEHSARRRAGEEQRDAERRRVRDAHQQRQQRRPGHDGPAEGSTVGVRGFPVDMDLLRRLHGQRRDQEGEEEEF